ncbi:unnamed protein product, partial [Ascophyllum nodosum]
RLWCSCREAFLLARSESASRRKDWDAVATPCGQPKRESVFHLEVKPTLRPPETLTSSIAGWIG